MELFFLPTASSGPVDAADQERALKAKPAVWPGRIRQTERPRARARDQFAARVSVPQHD